MTPRSSEQPPQCARSKAQQGRPHLMGLVNRLLALAADLTPEPTDHDQEDQ